MFSLKNLFKKKEKKEEGPVMMYKVAYCEQTQQYHGYERKFESHLAPFVKVDNTWSATLDFSKSRLKAVLRERKNAKSEEFNYEDA